MKEVDTLKSTPMEYVSHVDESGHRSVVEVRISVLSSQHEGSFFRVKFSVVDPETKKTLEAFSHPLKIISKRNQVRKMMARSESVIVENPSALPPKRTSSDQIAESLLRLEEQQRLQLNLLEALAQKTLTSSNGFVYHPPSSVPDPDDMDFDVAFKHFLKAYKKISVEDRASKLRKTMKSAASDDMDTLNDFINVYSSEVLMQTPVDSNLLNSLLSTPQQSNCSSNCSGDCPHKKELERLDTFYHEFLFEPQSPEMETA